MRRGAPFSKPLAAVLLCTALWFTGCTTPEPLPVKTSSPSLPPPETAEAPPTFEYFPYHVKPGDTLYSLGRRFRVSWEEVAEINGITRVDEMPVGRLLIIPRAPGVEVPPFEPSETRTTAPSGAKRRTVQPEALHRGHSSSRFWWPTAGRLLRRYGSLVRGLPDAGIAIGAPAGTEVCAVADGKVVAIVGAGGQGVSAWGRVVALSHSGGHVSWYGHLDRVLVRKGQRVRKGHAIGTVGASGAAPSPQLAFRLYRNDRPVDPLDELP